MLGGGEDEGVEGSGENSKDDFLEFTFWWVIAWRFWKQNKIVQKS